MSKTNSMYAQQAFSTREMVEYKECIAKYVYEWDGNIVGQKRELILGRWFYASQGFGVKVYIFREWFTQEHHRYHPLTKKAYQQLTFAHSKSLALLGPLDPNTRQVG